MVLYIFCKNCGKVIDEYESVCYWCGIKCNPYEFKELENGEEKDERHIDK